MQMSHRFTNLIKYEIENFFDNNINTPYITLQKKETKIQNQQQQQKLKFS